MSGYIIASRKVFLKIDNWNQKQTHCWSEILRVIPITKNCK